MSSARRVLVVSLGLTVVGCGEGSLGVEGHAAPVSDGRAASPPGDARPAPRDAARDAQQAPTSDVGAPPDVGSAAPGDAAAPLMDAQPADAAPPDPDAAEPGPADRSDLVVADLPASLGCLETYEAAVTMRNTGAAAWSEATGHRLGAVGDADPLSVARRVPLPAGVQVSPGQSHVFRFRLTAPAQAGRHVTDWQMVREGVGWFGAVARREVEVVCQADGPPPGEPDLAAAVWLHADVSRWPATARLASVTFRGGQICLDYDQAGAWPERDMQGVAVNANPWVFIHQDARWYAATWEWMRPGQTCKSMSSVAGDHIKRRPFDEASGWRPHSGQTLYFMVSGLARNHLRNVEIRTNLVRVVWP